MFTVKQIYDLLNQKAPFFMQESWDNSGMLVGRWNAPVERVLTTLDITPDTIQQAIDHDCQLIVSHHPVIFDKLRQVRDDDYNGERVVMLLENGISAICSHTSLDSAPNGVNDVLAALCGLTGETIPLEQGGVDANGTPYGVGRVGNLAQPMRYGDYLTMLKHNLNLAGLRYSGDLDATVSRVAVGGGSCGSMIPDVLKLGCDTFVTADLKYDHFLGTPFNGLKLVDAGHFETENPVMSHVSAWIREAFPEVQVIEAKRIAPIFYF